MWGDGEPKEGWREQKKKKGGREEEGEEVVVVSWREARELVKAAGVENQFSQTSLCSLSVLSNGSKILAPARCSRPTMQAASLFASEGGGGLVPFSFCSLEASLVGKLMVDRC